MSARIRPRRHRLLRNAYGSAPAEAFMITAILVTRLYLELAGYPQVGGGSLHIAHALYGGALMMLALLTGWMFLGFGVRAVCVALGGVGFGLFLDEVGKFVTKDNDYFYGPSAEIMYILVASLLVLARVIRDLRVPTDEENLANAAAIAAEGIARGLPAQRRAWAHRMLDRAESHGADLQTTASIRALLDRAPTSSARLHTARVFGLRLVPPFLKSPRWVPVLGWLLVASSFLGVAFGALGAALGGVFYEDDSVTFELEGLNMATAILLVSASLTLALTLPAMTMLHRTDELWPLRCLRYAALIFTMLNALVDFATQGFAALLNLGIGLFTLALISYRLNVRAAELAPVDAPEKGAGVPAAAQPSARPTS